MQECGDLAEGLHRPPTHFRVLVSEGEPERDDARTTDPAQSGFHLGPDLVVREQTYQGRDRALSHRSDPAQHLGGCRADGLVLIPQRGGQGASGLRAFPPEAFPMPRRPPRGPAAIGP